MYSIRSGGKAEAQRPVLLLRERPPCRVLELPLGDRGALKVLFGNGGSTAAASGMSVVTAGVAIFPGVAVVAGTNNYPARRMG